jgi:pyruvate dehydrogenase E2 component (dihydrolipoamide acetyltransferase)
VVPIGDPIAIIAAPGEQVDVKALTGQGATAEPAKAAEAPAKAAAPTRSEAADPPSPPEQRVPPPATPETPAPPAPVAPGPNGHAEEAPGFIKVSPIARRMADERRIDLRQVQGTGPGGRITKKDIENWTPPPTPKPEAAPAGAPAYGAQDLSRIQKLIARRMTESKQQVPHFYVTTEIDMAEAMRLRAQMNEMLDEEHKISVNDLIVKASALALRKFPRLNASFQGEQLNIHEAINIGNAVAREEGLITAVVKEVDRKPLSQVAFENRAVITRARENKMRPEDTEGATFTVSNLGPFDVENFIAIINPPNAAILAVGSVRDVPVVKDGQIVPGKRLKATISVDHRVSDGAEAARFLQVVKQALEQPLRLVM